MKQIASALLIHLLFLSVSRLWAVSGADIDTVRERRFSGIVGATTGATSIPAWISTLGADGKWPDSEIDYTSGCDAQTASWPAQEHWSRITTFAAAWHGGLNNAEQYANSSDLRATISLAMNFWFINDFTDPSCLDSGGEPACPCGTPGFWNTNWFSNIILIPGFVGETCLLLGDSLASSELANCTRFTGRAYATFQTGINGVSAITGSNTLDIASIGVDQGLLISNDSLVSDAYGRVHSEVTVKNGIKADGIRADGSFGQHTGILYNGNYGKDYANDVFSLEIASAGTQFQADADSMSAFSTLLIADQWMIFRNVVTGVLHWDFSVLGRFISLPVADNQATASIKTNLTQLLVLGEEWNSDALSQVFEDLSTNSTDANVGPLIGNHMFYANDYMVQRGEDYITTLKMFSNRTQNTECTNTQNPFGFHLSDGTTYSYLQGDEYEDIAAAWDWNLIPGITVDYGATVLSCDTARKTGTQPFVGGASDGTVGVAAMRYETPTTKTLNWRKTWFFLDDDVQFVMVARITSTTTAPVFSVLDQRKHVGDVFVDAVAAESGNFTGVSSLWHGGVGYTFNSSNTAVSLSLQLGDRTGSWQTIGSSKQPPTTVDLFAAWLSHNDLTVPIAYAVYPGTTLSSFQQKSAASGLQTIRNDGSISALLDTTHQMAMVVFWEAAGGSVSIPSATGNAPITIKSTGSSNLIFRMDTWVVTLSDPTQFLTTITLNFTLGSGTIPAGWGSGSKTKSLTIALPSGGQIGSSITQSLPS